MPIKSRQKIKNKKIRSILNFDLLIFTSLDIKSQWTYIFMYSFCFLPLNSVIIHLFSFTERTPRPRFRIPVLLHTPVARAEPRPLVGKSSTPAVRWIENMFSYQIHVFFYYWVLVFTYLWQKKKTKFIFGSVWTQTETFFKIYLQLRLKLS